MGELCAFINEHSCKVSFVIVAEPGGQLTDVFINQITTSVPPYDIHHPFADFAPTQLEPRRADIFRRMSERSGIDHRYSFLNANAQDTYLDDAGFYQRGNFPGTEQRMRFYQENAFDLAREALDKFDSAKLQKVTHIIVTSCTGFYAPGLDLDIVRHYGLPSEIERTMIGFMGCYAAFNAMKLARHIVRSAPNSQVLIVNLELCTLHLQETNSIEELLSYLIFADGCAASLISSSPYGLRMDSFQSTIVPDSMEQITWNIGDIGFDMVLSGKVPGTISLALPMLKSKVLGGKVSENIDYWAIHPGGRSVLDAVQKGFDLPDAAMHFSREVLRAYGNMSSATVMFVLKDILDAGTESGSGCSMAFGPGVTVESMLFHKIAT